MVSRNAICRRKSPEIDEAPTDIAW